jgi:hypothetical protein
VDFSLENQNTFSFYMCQLSLSIKKLAIATKSLYTQVHASNICGTRYTVGGGATP